LALRSVLVCLCGSMLVAGLASADGLTSTATAQTRPEGPSAECGRVLGTTLATLLHTVDELRLEETGLRGFEPRIRYVRRAADPRLDSQFGRLPSVDLAELTASADDMASLRRIAAAWPMTTSQRDLATARCAVGETVTVLIVSSDNQRALVADRTQSVFACDLRRGRRARLRDVNPLTEVRVFGDLEMLYAESYDRDASGTMFALPRAVVLARLPVGSPINFATRTFYTAPLDGGAGEVRELDTGRRRARIPIVRGTMVAVLVAESGRRVLRVDGGPLADSGMSDELESTTPRAATLEDGRGHVLARITLDPFPNELGLAEILGFAPDESRIVRIADHEVHVFDSTTGATIFRGRCERGE
jgi:hypothetical protein